MKKLNILFAVLGCILITAAAVNAWYLYQNSRKVFGVKPEYVIEVVQDSARIQTEDTILRCHVVDIQKTVTIYNFTVVPLKNFANHFTGLKR